MNESIKNNPMYKFREKLSNKIKNEGNGYLTPEKIDENWNNDFHEKFKNQIKDNYFESRREFQDMLLENGITGFDGKIKKEDLEDMQKDVQEKIINASMLANFYQMYKAYYSIIVN